MVTVLLFLIILGILVFVHELGHFMVARWNGIKADEFGFGFPPRIGGVVFDDKTKRYRFVRGNEEISSPHTVYSLNWIPLGGFVKIKGEDGEQKDQDSFAVKSAWVRIKVLAAGVTMNFLLAWVLISFVLMLGFPQAVDPGAPNQAGERDIQISEVLSGTPAEQMGLQFGDKIVSFGENQKAMSVKQVQDYITEHKGQEIVMRIDRGGQQETLRGTPRTEYPANEGSLGISLGETVMVKYAWYEAIWQGALGTHHMTIAMLVGIFDIVKGLVTGTHEGLSSVSGPVGIAHLTKQVSDLGLVYLMYFAAILSINLGIINILPIPALDGGRIFFVLIEVLKGSPVSQRVEGTLHQVGFMLLLLLMVLVTVHDFSKFKIIEKLFGG